MKTLSDIANKYNKARADIIARLKEGNISASMSGIEYYPKPWEELDTEDEGDMFILSTWIKGDTHEGLRPFTPAEIEVRQQLRDLMSEPIGAARNKKMDTLQAMVRALRIEYYKDRW